jgi:hypothetical protein
MGKVTCDAIKFKLAQKIKVEFLDLEWKGVDVRIVESIDSLQPILASDFRYEGHGEYEFSGDINFMVKDKNTQNDSHREFYRIYPCCKMYIKEKEDDFDIEISSSIFLQKKF